MQDMYMLIIVSRRKDSKEIIENLQRLEVPILYTTPAKGTAQSEILDIFGLEESEKTVYQTVISRNKLKEVKTYLKNDFRIYLPDRGVALAIPLSSISTRRTLDYFSGGHTEDEMIDNNENGTFESELIIAICNHGYTSEVMEAARKAGSSGGTVLHAKGTASEYANSTFFGMSIVDEKDIIYIVVKKSIRNNVMQAICEKAGAKTDAHTLVFSLPVSETIGI